MFRVTKEGMETMFYSIWGPNIVQFLWYLDWSIKMVYKLCCLLEFIYWGCLHVQGHKGGHGDHVLLHLRPKNCPISMKLELKHQNSYWNPAIYQNLPIEASYMFRVTKKGIGTMFYSIWGQNFVQFLWNLDWSIKIYIEIPLSIRIYQLRPFTW